MEALPVLPDSGLRLIVQHNGRALPAGMTCRFAIVDDAGSNHPISEVDCGQVAMFDEGERAVRVTLGMGHATRTFALTSEHLGGTRDEIVEAATPIGRLRVRHTLAESTGVKSCNVAITEKGAAVATGPDDAFYEIFAGTYDATLICNADDGVRSPTISNINVHGGEDRQVNVGVLPLKNGEQPATQEAPPAPVVTTAPPDAPPPPAPVYFIPGQPMPAAGQPTAQPDYGHP